MEQLKDLNSHRDKLDFCPYCRSESSGGGSSLHGWDVQFKCGCVLKGSHGETEVYLDTECPVEDDGELLC